MTMFSRCFLIATAAATLAACSAPSADNHDEANLAVEADTPALPPPEDGLSNNNLVDTATDDQAGLAQDLTLVEWRKADNRSTCAPLVLTDDGGADGTPRRANFGGGWAVAFDTPATRSAYGVAGTGVTVTDRDAEIKRIAELWPNSKPPGRDSGGLPSGAFASYGPEGGGDYPADNPTGVGLNSLAYVVIPGQRCLYNIWSRRGKAHLETLLDGLQLVEPS